MRKINFTILLSLILVLVGSGSNAFAQKRAKKNQVIIPPYGWLNIKTTPEAYPVFINGVEKGLTGSPDAKEFQLDPGTYDVEIHFPEKTYAKKITVDAGKRNCMCLAIKKNKITRPCPYDVSIDAPTAVIDGDNIVFSANPTYTGPATTLNYKWTVTPATVQIREGQGTPSITIDSTNLGGQRIVATLEADSGYNDATCRQRIPVSVDVTPLQKEKPKPQEVDRFDFINNDAMKARLDNYAVALQNQPDVQGYVVVYGKTGGKPADADRLGMRALEYLTRNRQIDPRRVIVVNSGFRSKAGFELYLVPPGADPPTSVQ